MPIFQQQEIIEIEHGGARMRLAPQAGGRLLSWDVEGEPVIRWPDPADWRNPPKIRGGNPLLFPFLGRHFVNGELGHWRDAQGVVHDLPQHGFARDLPFSAQVDDAAHAVTMTLTDSDATRSGYPFAFRFEARYTLVDATTLDVSLTTVNTGTARLPYYAGHHFYFALPHTARAATRLELPAAHRRRQLPDGAISPAEPDASSTTLDDASIIDCFHCLDGAPGRPVRIVEAQAARAITMDLTRPGSAPWYAVTTWTEAADSDFYCVEPWLGLPDAIHNGMGLRWVEAGASETASLRLSVSPLA